MSGIMSAMVQSGQKSPIANKNGWYAGGSPGPTLTASAGDFLVASVSVLSTVGSPTITAPAGWTSVNSVSVSVPGVYFIRHSIYQKVATGSEGTQTWTSSVAVTAMNTYVTSWTGVDAATGIEANANSNVPGTGLAPISTSEGFPSVTTLSTNAMVFLVALAGDISGTAPGTIWPTVGPPGFTTSLASVVVMGGNYNIQVTAGSTGTLSVTVDTDVYYWSAWTLSLKAA